MFEFDDFDDLRISMNAGNDYWRSRATVFDGNGDLDITVDLVISMGSGTDRVNINFVQVKGDMFVDMGSSNDKLNIKNTKLGDDSADGEISDLNINGGDGNDSLNLFRNTIEGLTNRTSTLTPTSKDLWF